MIETTTNACSVALFAGDDLIDERSEQIGRGHAERLIPMIAELMDGGRAARILVGCGPGSFTGIRVGVAAARALGLGWGADVSGYSTMALYAATGFADAPDATELVVALVGGHGELFVQHFAAAPFLPMGEVASLVPQAATQFCSANYVIGSAAESFVAVAGHGSCIPCEIAARDVRFLPPTFKQLQPSPIYVRGADAKPLHD